MKINIIKSVSNITMMLALLLLLGACKRTDDVVGTEFIGASESFEIVTPFAQNVSTVDFSNSETVSFTAEFNETVTWIITITGKTSGAKKVISATSNEINSSFAVWNGNHDELYFFRDGETADVEMSVLGSTETSSIEVTITNAKDFGASSMVYTLDGENKFDGTVDGWTVFSQDKVETSDDILAVQGSGSLFMTGAGEPDFITGASKNVTGTTSLPSYLPTDPDSVWINIYVYGQGDADTKIDFACKEADADEGNTKYGEATDDAMGAEIIASHTGWKLFSIQYSALKPSVAADFGGSGNKVHEPHRIDLLQIGLLTLDPEATKSVYVDFPVITVGGPFDPSSL